MRSAWLCLCVTFLMLNSGGAAAKVDLVTLPKRDAVQLTLYNAADLTLVREQRALTLKAGLNRLQFSWANTLIDPTSLDLLPKTKAGEIDILDLAFPARMRNLGLWRIESRVSGRVPVTITYLTSGLTWRAFYMGTLSRDEKTMPLKGYVRVTNRSGEDYENARVRMVVGKVHLMDRIADLAQREHPYGRPGPKPYGLREKAADGVPRMAEARQTFARVAKAAAARPKEITKEGLSEYFLYTIEGTETIPHGWSKRLPSFDADGVPVVNLYKYDETRYGKAVMRFLSFKNDAAHKLGKTPMPGGTIQLYRNLGEAARLAYEGQSQFKYIPVGEDVELNLGPVSNVMVAPTLRNTKTDRYLFNQKGNISGWDEVRETDMEVRNTREIPVRMEITRHLQTKSWDLQTRGDFGQYEKVDLDTVRFSMNLAAGESKTFTIILTVYHGQRAQ